MIHPKTKKIAKLCRKVNSQRMLFKDASSLAFRTVFSLLFELSRGSEFIGSYMVVEEQSVFPQAKSASTFTKHCIRPVGRI